MAAAVQVVELRLGDRVVHVDGREQQLAVFHHFVETLDARGGLFGDALDASSHTGPLARVGFQRLLKQAENDGEFGVGCLGRIGHCAGFFELDALVQQHCGVTTIVENHVRAVVDLTVRAVRPRHHLVGAPPVLLQCLALPGKDRHALRIVDGAMRANNSCRCCMVLRRENIATGPADLGTECGERLDENGGLDRHVQRARNTAASKRLRFAKLFAGRHQTGHLVLGEDHLFAAEGREFKVGDAEVFGLCEARERGVSHYGSP